MACPPGQTKYSRDHLARELNFWGPFVHGYWVLNWLETVCTEGPMVGDQISRDHKRLGPNVSQTFLGSTIIITINIPHYVGN